MSRKPLSRDSDGQAERSIPAVVTHEAIATRAYSIYLRNDCPQGRSQEHWLQAESELRARAEAAAESAHKSKGGRAGQSGERINGVSPGAGSGLAGVAHDAALIALATQSEKSPGGDSPAVGGSRRAPRGRGSPSSGHDHEATAPC
ncbi:MAG: DUF2934 domain-containing protein [Phycisphaerales bacterium]|nr:DUF2934 domain-containing protein [Phycisphaerales bacterium]